MRKVFVTYSHDDTEFVERLVEVLDLSGLNVTLDKRVLNPGDSLLKIFEEIGYSGFLVPVLSQNSIHSNWVKKELGVAIVKEIEEPEFKVVPVVKTGEIWDELRTSMPTGLREALRDKLVARFDTKPYEDALKELLKALSPDQDPQELYAKIQGPRSDNPFRRVRTEYFENVQLLARSFTEPESERYERIMEVKPTRIEGGRGSGKTMILRSLETTVSVYRCGAKSFSDAHIRHFGIYCRLTQGSFATQGGDILAHIPMDVATRLFTSELILQLVQSFIEELQQCSVKQIIVINGQQESELSQEITEVIRPGQLGSSPVRDFQALKGSLRNELRLIQDYISRKIMSETLSYNGVFLSKTELREICKCILQALPDLNDTTVYFLLDEYENLLPFQKVVVNTLIKWSESQYFTLKIASKKTGFQDPQTLEKQEIEESHDYSRVDLDYDISDSEHRGYYKDLLIKICQKILQNEGFKIPDVQKLLEPRQSLDGFGESEIEVIIADIVKKQSDKEWAELDEESRREYWHRLEVGALYRALRAKRKKKQFAGVDDFILLSSGIIRYFLELCGMSYYFAIQKGINVKAGEQIKAKHQTEATYTLSSYYLATIRKNIADHGPKTQQLIIDLGDIFRQKLLNHMSEPEAARLSITDPQALEDASMQDVKQLLDVAEMHSVLQVPSGLGGIRPKHATEVQPKEYLPNRIFAPVLQFSPRPRWRTKFECQDIKGLLDSVQRKEIKAKLIRSVSGIMKEEKRLRASDEQHTLFEHDLTGGNADGG